jgi:methyl-accepting chemotaxis protein
VRKLAEKSQIAAQEIGTLAANSVSVADRAGKLFNEILPNIDQTSQLINEIAAASEEQDNAITNFNETVEHLGIVAATNSSASEELASTAELLNSEAQHLNTIINFFKLKGVETQ